MLLRPQKKINTLQEIAAASQVSLSTVYRILRNPAKADTPIRKHVCGLLLQNGYLENYQIRGKITILSVISAGGSSHISATYFELQKVCMQRGINLLSCDYESLDRILKNTAVDGLVYNISIDDIRTDIPHVVLRQGYDCSQCFSVCVDDIAGIHQILQRLKDLGHRRIFYFAAANDKAPHFVPGRQIRDMIAGLYDSVQLPLDKNLICFRHLNKDTHEKVMNEVVDYFFSLPDRPTAIVLCSDVYAGVFYSRIRARGLRIPQDISIAGFDNLNRYLHFYPERDRVIQEVMNLKPKLTTCDIPMEELAGSAIDLIQAQIANPLLRRRKIMLQPEVIFTGSIGPAGAAVHA